MKNKKVIIYQRVLPHYRVPFFETLYHKLLEQNIELTVVYGQEYPGTVPASVKVDRPWAHFKANYYLRWHNKELVFQAPIFKSLFDRSTIVIEHANRLTIIYLFLLCRALFNKKVAFWGHGRNFQSSNNESLKERFKKGYTNFVDWWFCYTEKGKGIISANGFKSEQVTVVANSIDTKELIEQLNTITPEDRANLKNSMGITSDCVAVYCGGMYSIKRIPFLLEVCLAIKAQLVEFEMLFIGNGPDDAMVKQFCTDNKWAHFLGPIAGKERVQYFAISQCQLIPGAIGLGVLDSFALDCPLITVESELHGPEIEYLVNNENGLIVDDNMQDYTKAAIQVLTDDKVQAQLKKGCNDACSQYSIEQMANNFASGIQSLVDAS